MYVYLYSILYIINIDFDSKLLRACGNKNNLALVVPIDCLDDNDHRRGDFKTFHEGIIILFY